MIRILTNPGANLPESLIERYQIALTSSSIVVDGDLHDLRAGVTLRDVDRWVEQAMEHPYVLGTSAAEFVAQYSALGVAKGNGVVVVMSSRKIIQSYDAACSAVRTFASRATARPAIEVVDTAMTDLGMGMPALAAARAAAAGKSLEEVAELARAMAAGGRFVFVPRTLDNLVRGGKASFLRGWIADVLRVRPILSFVDGEATLVGKCSAKADHGQVVADRLRADLETKGPVWVGVSHGGTPDEADALLEILRRRFDVRLALVREITPSVYLHAGPRCLGAVVFPLADLPWIPPAS